MLVMSPNHIHIDHVMWQPQFTCQSHCNHCYIRRSIAASWKQGPVTEILNLIFEQKKVGCDQFTISLDGVPCFTGELAPTLKELWRILEQEGAHLPNSSPHMPEICITVKNMSSLDTWARALDLSIYSFLRPVHMLSISWFPYLGKDISKIAELCSNAGTDLNWNLLLQPDRGGVLGTSLTPIKYADSTYLICQKSPLGEKQRGDHCRFWEEIIEKTPELRGPRVHKDDCMTEVTQYIKHGRACSAGTRKVAVWPNGGVTACPYDTNGVSTEKQDTWESLKEAINPDPPKIKRCRLVDAVASQEKPQESEKIIDSNDP